MPLILLILSCLGVAFLVGLAYILRPKYLEKFARTPRVPIAEIAGDQFAKATGRVRYCGEPLRAPFTGRPCAAYRVAVWQQGFRRPHEVFGASSRQDFLLVDGTGKALVEVDKALMFLRREFTSPKITAVTPALAAFLERHGQRQLLKYLELSIRQREQPRVFEYREDLSWEETILEAGQEVTVGGDATREPDPAPESYRELPTRAVFRGTAIEPLFITNRPDGSPDSRWSVRLYPSE
jgi:hypothetical protein